MATMMLIFDSRDHKLQEQTDSRRMDKKRHDKLPTYIKCVNVHFIAVGEIEFLLKWLTC